MKSCFHGTSKLKRSWRTLARDEGGDAVIIAIIVVLLLSLIPIALYASSIQQLPMARHDQDYQRALAAANAGVSDYLNNLNQSVSVGATSYWSSGSTPSTGAGQWTQVPGSTNEYFYYPVPTYSGGSSAPPTLITLTSTGLSFHGATSVERTVTVSIRQSTPMDYGLATQQQTIFPTFSNSVAGSTSNTDSLECAYRYDQPNDNTNSNDPKESTEHDTAAASNTTGPEDIKNTCYKDLSVFTTGNTYSGPMYSNDIYYVSGSPSFTGALTSSSTRQSPLVSPNGYWWNPKGAAANPTWYNSTPPTYVPPLQFPTSLVSVKKAAEASPTGCVYDGPTYFDFASNGSVVITTTNPLPTVDSGKPCGSGSLTAGLATTQPPLSPLPSSIYVESTPPDPATYLPPATCSPTTPVTLIIGLGLYQKPTCEGDAFVQGIVNGQTTVAADNNAYFVGNLDYNGCAGSGTTDFLGVLAYNWVAVGTSLGTSAQDTNTTSSGMCGYNASSHIWTIMAGVLSINYGFADEKNIPASGTCVSSDCYGLGPDLNFEGSIAGQFANLYATNISATMGQASSTTLVYLYDSRFSLLTPPLFPAFANGAWHSMNFSEITNPATLPALP